MIHPIKHLKVICHHRHLVIKHAAKAGIFWQGLGHDLSKFSPVEFFTGAKYFLGNRSPNERERELFGYSSAWLHHKGRNKHHFEYWNDVNPKTKRYEPVKMPTRYLVEMFCDRVAASKIYQGKNYSNHHPLEYFNRGNAKNVMHPETANKLHELLVILDEQGEKAAFKAVKKLVKEKIY